jgi:chemotaxis protein CheD
MTLDELLKNSGIAHGPARKGVDVTPDGMRRVYLHAGQLYASDQRVEVVTILGSCVAVCLYDAARGIGGINHFMLPMDGTAVSARYANHAFDLLVRQLAALGASQSRLQAKVFGGASILGEGAITENDLGARNVAAARARLVQERIPLIAEDVGGCHGRKLLFDTSTGGAQVKQV